MGKRIEKVYVKDGYKAIEDGDTNYFTFYYQDRKLFGENKVSLCFIKDMGFTQVLDPKQYEGLSKLGSQQ